LAARLELVPENQRDLSAEPGVADLVQSRQQFVGGFELGQIENPWARSRPGKAVMLLDAAAARASITGGAAVTLLGVYLAVSRMMGEE